MANSITAHQATEKASITLEKSEVFSLFQIAAWPETITRAAASAKKFAKSSSVPGPGQSCIGKQGNLLRVEPLKWWLISENATANMPHMPNEAGAVLDLSHSRTWIKASGEKAETLLNHFLPLDLREGAFLQGAVASSAMHHVGVTLWREENHYSLLVPRSFSETLWEMLTESALQYGLEPK